MQDVEFFYKFPSTVLGAEKKKPFPRRGRGLVGSLTPPARFLTPQMFSSWRSRPGSASVLGGL